MSLSWSLNLKVSHWLAGDYAWNFPGSCLKKIWKWTNFRGNITGLEIEKRRQVVSIATFFIIYVECHCWHFPTFTKGNWGVLSRKILNFDFNLVRIPILGLGREGEVWGEEWDQGMQTLNRKGETFKWENTKLIIKWIMIQNHKKSTKFYI